MTETASTSQAKPLKLQVNLNVLCSQTHFLPLNLQYVLDVLEASEALSESQAYFTVFV
ncbi:uncharacterized protein PHALS_06325 [Plasmopara halstedii]|uniref:Uncharacterized protein n=1 Tax=Plasmopara halstedii TaxID=4781 RepID=A0A0P1B3P8_PLAHL|nr:uncharacterized protein PHALS_06325 [Plasmopara halstedii]CEG48506.1 hypothetical protein PHALS_06325 [Plasmopara halstedii]|eukprot:XP_024584875.1 hypothetical protein PHALS_06325 [Plasmopara halstedii]